jgi:DNA-binding transcriptional LysR family regulator
LIHIENRESQQLVTAVETGALHVAVLRPPRNAGTLRVESLRRDPFVVAMRTDHPLAKADALRLRDLKGAKLVRISRGDLREAFDEIDQQLNAAGLDLEQSQRADTTLTAMAFVAAGDGVSVVPSWAASLSWKDVCFRQVRDLTACIDLAIAWEATNLPPIAEHFIEVARRTAA